MRKKLQNYSTALFIFITTLLLGISLSGCMPQANTYSNGVSAGTLSESNIPTSALLVWTAGAAISVYNYDYTNYQTNLQNASQYFTPDGWQAFMASLTASGNLTKLIKNQMSISAITNGTPVLLSQGELAGRYSWKVRVPLLVSYQSSGNYQEENLVVTMLIVRTSTAAGVRGLGIKQFIVLKGNPVLLEKTQA